MTTNGKPALTETLRNLEVAISSVPIAELPGLLGLLEKVKAMGWGRMLAVPSNGRAEMDLLTAPDIAKLLKISEYKAYDLIRQGEIKKTSIGDSVRVKPSDLATYIDRNRDCAETAIVSILGGSTKE